MRILIACEFSGTVRDAFIARGHDAVSCDLLPTESPGPHIQCDVLSVLDDGWDMMIAHPPCTYLSVSGLHWNKRGVMVGGRHRAELTEDALDFVRALMDAPIPKIALENPVSCISTRIRKPDQKIHPWMFGHDASKTTCLWLKGLPKLDIFIPAVFPPAGWQTVVCAADMERCECCDEPFCVVCDAHYADCRCLGPAEDDATYEMVCGVMFGHKGNPIKMRWGNQTPSGQNKLGPSPDRWKLRSITYQGIADAMANQWG